MNAPISISSIRQLFTEARNAITAWLDKPVADGLLHEVLPTWQSGARQAQTHRPCASSSSNRTSAKEKLMPALMGGKRRASAS